MKEVYITKWACTNSAPIKSSKYWVKLGVYQSTAEAEKAIENFQLNFPNSDICGFEIIDNL